MSKDLELNTKNNIEKKDIVNWLLTYLPIIIDIKDPEHMFREPAWVTMFVVIFVHFEELLTVHVSRWIVLHEEFIPLFQFVP